jgi:hypothetical protein
MKKYIRFDLPGIAYITAVLAGILLFMLRGESLVGVKPNLIWVAGLTGFLFASGVLSLWLHWRNQKG